MDLDLYFRVVLKLDLSQMQAIKRHRDNVVQLNTDESNSEDTAQINNEQCMDQGSEEDIRDLVDKMKSRAERDRSFEVLTSETRAWTLMESQQV